MCTHEDRRNEKPFPKGGRYDAFILIRGLGRMERVSAGDGELAQAATRVYNAGAPLPTAELQSLIARYTPYAGYWAFYLRNAAL